MHRDILHHIGAAQAELAEIAAARHGAPPEPVPLAGILHALIALALIEVYRNGNGLRTGDSVLASARAADGDRALSGPGGIPAAARLTSRGGAQ